MGAFAGKPLRIETFLSRTVCVGGKNFYLSLYGKVFSRFTSELCSDASLV